MDNIHKIRVYLIRYANHEQFVTSEHFEMATTHEDWFLGLRFDYTPIVDDFTDFAEVHTYSVFEFDDIDKKFSDTIAIFKSYIGIGIPVNETINLLLDDKPFPKIEGYHVEDEANDRKSYLECVIHYKLNQEGKPQNTFNLKIRDYYDFLNYCNGELISCDKIKANYDTSRYEVVVKTYLTEEEIKEKFKFYLV